MASLTDLLMPGSAAASEKRRRQVAADSVAHGDTYAPGETGAAPEQGAQEDWTTDPWEAPEITGAHRTGTDGSDLGPTQMAAAPPPAGGPTRGGGVAPATKESLLRKLANPANISKLGPTGLSEEEAAAYSVAQDAAAARDVSARRSPNLTTVESNPVLDPRVKQLQEQAAGLAAKGDHKGAAAALEQVRQIRATRGYGQ